MDTGGLERRRLRSKSTSINVYYESTRRLFISCLAKDILRTYQLQFLHRLQEQTISRSVDHRVLRNNSVMILLLKKRVSYRLTSSRLSPSRPMEYSTLRSHCKIKVDCIWMDWVRLLSTRNWHRIVLSCWWKVQINTCALMLHLHQTLTRTAAHNNWCRQRSSSRWRAAHC